MKGKILLIVVIVLAFADIAAAQETDAVSRATLWKAFNKNNFEKVNFAKTRLTKARISKLKVDGDVDEVALLRGVVFGKRGRIFKERSIQDYLEKQPWYKPNKDFSNSMLTTMERANLDLIRLGEAEKHPFVEPGDMRIWKGRRIDHLDRRDRGDTRQDVL